jgi:hypothetical protein
MLLLNPYRFGGGGGGIPSVLLMHFDGTDGSTTFTDEYGHTVTPSGNAQIDTAQSKFGGASGLFDGSGDYLSTTDSDDWSFGSGDFTVEGWIRPSTVSVRQEILAQRNDTLSPNDFWAVSLTSSGTIRTFAIAGGAAVTDRTGTTVLSTNTWYHVAIVRLSGSVQIYVEGVGNASGGTNGAGAWPNSTSALYFGVGDNAGSNAYSGHMDEWRITKEARYTANFTPPSAAFTE